MQGVTVRTVRRRALLIASVGSVALGAPAFAQQAAPGAASSDNVIVVTAQKREQDIQDVPISAASDARISRRRISIASPRAGSRSTGPIPIRASVRRRASR